MHLVLAKKASAEVLELLWVETLVLPPTPVLGRRGLFTRAGALTSDLCVQNGVIFFSGLVRLGSHASGDVEWAHN